jgi:hypothetical protein
MKFGWILYIRISILSLLLAWLIQTAAPAHALLPADYLCLRCHASPPVQTLGELTWLGPVRGEREHPCPGVSRIKQELYLTQSLFYTAAELIGTNRDTAPDGAWLSLMSIKARFRDSLNQPVWSVEQILTGQSGLRKELTHRIIKPIWRDRDQAGKRLFWGIAAMGFVGLGLCALLMYFWRRRGIMRGIRLQAGHMRPGADADKEPHDA